MDLEPLIRGAAVALLLCCGSAIAAPAAPAPERAAQLRHLVRQDCGACHGLSLGGGLGGPLTPAALKDKPDASLAAVILAGRPGTPMPPWRPFLTEEEAIWLVYWLKQGAPPLIPALAALLGGCAAPALRGTGDLGVVIERASGSVQVVDNTRAESLGRVEGLGDLSHASVVFSRDARYAYVFGRDGAISKVDLLRRRLERRVVQAGNSIGGAISSDGRVLAAQNYQPGGVRLFDAATLAPLASVPAAPGADGKPSRVVGLADLPGRRFVYALFDADEIDVLDAADPAQPQLTRYRDAGKRPYDGLASMDGRYFLAGLYGEDGLSLLDTWRPEQGVRRILAGYGRGQQPLPVYKMPHLRGWALAGDYAFLPAIGRHEVLLADNRSWAQLAAIPVLGQPVFAMAEPSGRRVWVNFAFPDNDKVQVIDVPTRSVIATLKPGKAILHMEFTPRGDAVWLSSRDDDKLVVVDTASLKVLRELPARSPSGIFFSWRASRIGM